MKPAAAEVRATRIAAKLTQEAAAKLIGLGARERWAEYESGRHEMPVDKWQQFLELIGATQAPVDEVITIVMKTQRMIDRVEYSVEFNGKPIWSKSVPFHRQGARGAHGSGGRAFVQAAREQEAMAAASAADRRPASSLR